METQPAQTLERPSRTDVVRTVVQALIASFCLIMFAITAMCVCLTQLTPAMRANRDFVVYWATGQQFAHHANPYDPEALSRIEREAGLPSKYAVSFMRNPPWALPLTVPFGLLGFEGAFLVGILMLLASQVLSAHLLWSMYGRPSNKLHYLVYGFGPALVCLILGQTSLNALLVLVLFLRFHQNRPILAGMSLWLCALKPHLFLPFLVVLVAWVVVSKKYGVLAGAALSLVVTCSLVFAIDPSVGAQYLQMARTSGVEQQQIPCLSAALRQWLAPHAMWFQFVPTALASIWALTCFWRLRKTWDWIENGSLLVLVSLLTAPYSFLNDHVVVIPALLNGAYRSRSWKLIAVIALANAFTEVVFFSEAWVRSATYIGALVVAPVWLAWYLVTCMNSNRLSAL